MTSPDREPITERLQFRGYVNEANRGGSANSEQWHWLNGVPMPAPTSTPDPGPLRAARIRPPGIHQVAAGFAIVRDAAIIVGVILAVIFAVSLARAVQQVGQQFTQPYGNATAGPCPTPTNVSTYC